jgi:hypothetical protein
MPMWTSTDNANGAPIYAPAQHNLAPNTANRDALFGNVTADAFYTGKTDGVFSVSDVEIHIASKFVSTVAANNAGTAGSYIPGDILTLDTAGATAAITATVNVTATAVRTVVATAASGTGYANGDTLTCNTGVMTTNAVFTATTGAANTSLASLALTTNGVFTTNPTLAAGALRNLTVANTSANGATATVTMKLASVAINAPGRYSVQPTFIANNTPTGGSGTGATLAVAFATAEQGVTHTGWVKRTVGSGGRAGRVTYETLVAGTPITDGTADDTILPNS